MSLPHVILYWDANCQADHMHVCGPMAYVGDYFNDATSSFIIIDGQWEFYADANFQTLMGDPFAQNDEGIPKPLGVLGPGVYPWIEASTALGPNSNDRLSSLRPA